MDKSRSTIDIFVNYVLSNLKMRGGIDSNFKLLSGKNLITYGAGEKESIRKERKHKVIRGNYSHKQILASLYKELILNEGYAEAEGYTETANPILPPLFVDRFVSDFDKIVKFTDYWRNMELNPEDKAALKDALLETELEVEKYQEKFDFENALKFYKRLNLAAAELADSEKLSAGFLLKQVKIYFHLEQYDKSRDMIESCKVNFEKQKLNEELGELYYYMGMIAICTDNLGSADNHFIQSSRLLTKNALPEKTAIYYRSRIRRFILKKDYYHALSLLNESIGYSSRYNLNKELAYLYGLKAEIQIRSFKYVHAIESLHKQLEYSNNSKDLISEAKSISQIFSVRSYMNLFKKDDVIENFERVKKITKVIKKNSYYYNSLISYAIYLYRNDNIDDSELYFKKALKIYTSKTSNINSHIVNMLYLSKIRIVKKNYYGAILLLNRMLRLCENSSVQLYKSYILNLLGKIYYDQKKFKRSNFYLNIVIKIIEEDNINDKILIANTYMYSGYNNFYLKKNKTALNNLSLSKDIYLNINEKEDDSQISEYIDSISAKIDEISLISR
ncbi:TPA: hypothetical protein DCR49_04170 [Candidatus Delongbacteria bacterium]|nr:hypothetical protein [Candidatus Delongbacteria bacterium]